MWHNIIVYFKSLHFSAWKSYPAANMVTRFSLFLFKLLNSFCIVSEEYSFSLFSFVSMCLLSFRVFFWPASNAERKSSHDDLSRERERERRDTGQPRQKRGCAYFSFSSTQQVTHRPGEESLGTRYGVRYFDPLREGRILIVARWIRHFLLPSSYGCVFFLGPRL